MPRPGRCLLLASLLVAALSGVASAAPQDITLTFGSLPSAQGFAYVPSGSHAGALESNVFSVAGGVLTQNSMGLGHGVSGGSILYALNGIVTTTEAKQLRVRARCLQVEGSGAGAAGQQGFAFGFTTGSIQYDVSLTPTAIYALGPGGTVTVPGTYDNTQFHDYILEFSPPSTTRIYRDGVLLYTSTTGFAVAANRIFFGDGTGGANARAEITALRFVQDLTTPALETTWAASSACTRTDAPRHRRLDALRRRPPAAGRLVARGARGLTSADSMRRRLRSAAPFPEAPIPNSRRISAATTRTMTARPSPFAEAPRLLAPSQVLASPTLRLQYRIERPIGQGGFGQVYLASRVGRSADVAEVLCIKASERIDGWLREAYFGQVLEGHPRAIRVFDAFPLIGADGRILYCLALEYARHGDLMSYLRREPRGWTEKRVRREIAGILEVLGKLHRGQMLHRDLTPMNVFVCEGPSLKLGDFGIVRHQSDGRGITARTMNVMTAPSDIVAGEVPKWQARDDVYQVGQLLGMLARGDARSRLRTGDVRRLACGDDLKEIIHRCIGERRKRYESADELIEALRNPPAPLRVGTLRSLEGVHLAFTGILSRPRIEAARAAKRAGAIVHGGPSARTTVVVRGRPNTLQAAGRDAGLKLMEIKRLAKRGHRITLLDEARFWKLVKRR